MSVEELAPADATRPAAPPPVSAKRLAIPVLLAAAGQLAVWLMLPALLHPQWLGLTIADVSDVRHYFPWVTQMLNGLRPFADFPVEYPPLAVPLFALPAALAGQGRSLAFGTYEQAFFAEMMIASGLAAVAVTLAAISLWRSSLRAYAATGLYLAAVAAIGATLVHHYDAAIALVIAACALALVRKQWWLAGLAIGLGFGLKLLPAALLPLVLVLAPRPRSLASAAGAFAAAAAAPFVSVASQGPRALAGLLAVFQYHAARPLEVGSVYATPLFVLDALGLRRLRLFLSFGSENISGGAARLFAAASTWIELAALVLVYALVWRRREVLRTSPQAVPLAMTALVLALIAFGKVLSPQYFVWLLPLIPLVSMDRKALGGLLLTLLALTQLVYGQVRQLMDLNTAPVALLVARNILVVAAFGWALWELWRLRRPMEPSR